MKEYIGSYNAYQLFSQADFKAKEKFINNIEQLQLADHVEYFVDTDKQVLFIEVYKNGQVVDSMPLKSTKVKMAQFMKCFEKLQKEREFYKYD